MRGYETSLQIVGRAHQMVLEDDPVLTGRCCGRFGREACGDIAEKGDSHRAFLCCQAN